MADQIGQTVLLLAAAIIALIIFEPNDAKTMRLNATAFLSSCLMLVTDVLQGKPEGKTKIKKIISNFGIFALITVGAAIGAAIGVGVLIVAIGLVLVSILAVLVVAWFFILSIR